MARCLYCGKSISFFQQPSWWQKKTEFCSEEHKLEFSELQNMAIKRLMAQRRDVKFPPEASTDPLVIAIAPTPPVQAECATLSVAGPLEFFRGERQAPASAAQTVVAVPEIKVAPQPAILASSLASFLVGKHPQSIANGSPSKAVGPSPIRRATTLLGLRRPQLSGRLGADSIPRVNWAFVTWPDNWTAGLPPASAERATQPAKFIAPHQRLRPIWPHLVESLSPQPRLGTPLDMTLLEMGSGFQLCLPEPGITPRPFEVKPIYPVCSGQLFQDSGLQSSIDGRTAPRFVLGQLVASGHIAPQELQTASAERATQPAKFIAAHRRLRLIRPHAVERLYPQPRLGDSPLDMVVREAGSSFQLCISDPHVTPIPFEANPIYPVYSGQLFPESGLQSSIDGRTAPRFILSQLVISGPIAPQGLRTSRAERVTRPAKYLTAHGDVRPIWPHATGPLCPQPRVGDSPLNMVLREAECSFQLSTFSRGAISIPFEVSARHPVYSALPDQFLHSGPQASIDDRTLPPFLLDQLVSGPIVLNVMSAVTTFLSGPLALKRGSKDEKRFPTDRFPGVQPILIESLSISSEPVFSFVALPFARSTVSKVAAW